MNHKLINHNTTKMKRNLTMVAILVMTAILTNCSQSNPAAESEEPEGPTYNFVEGHAPVWNEAIAQILELAESMPEDSYGFTPHDSVRTFANQLLHIGGSSVMITNLFLKDIQPEGPPQDPEGDMSKEEVIASVKQNLEETWEIMKSMSDQQLDEEIENPFSKNTMTRREGLMFVHDHLTNHKAKANLYVRISGNEPPSYRYY